MKSFETLLDFARWFLKQPLLKLSPVEVFDYGPVRSLVLHRCGAFQVELFTIICNKGFPIEHRHPNVDTFEMNLYGEIPLTVNGKPAESFPLVVDGLTASLVNISTNDWHGAGVVPKGGAFLSIQQWLNGVNPSSVGLDWEGFPPSISHAKRLIENGIPIRRVIPDKPREVVDEFSHEDAQVIGGVIS